MSLGNGAEGYFSPFVFLLHWIVYILLNELILLFIMGEINNRNRILLTGTIRRNFELCSEQEDERKSKPAAPELSEACRGGGHEGRRKPIGRLALCFSDLEETRARERSLPGRSELLAGAGWVEEFANERLASRNQVLWPGLIISQLLRKGY